MKIRKGDEVVVICGDDKGTRGRVLKVFPKKERLIMENVNFVKRAVRRQQSPQPTQHSGWIEKQAPIHISNVMLIDPRGKTPTRVNYHLLQDGTKVRISKKSGEEIATN